MATAAHCFYCFECLSASFEGREPPSLGKVEDLWAQYEASRTSVKAKKSGAAGHSDNAEHVSDNLNLQDEEADEDGGEEEELEDGEESSSVQILSPRPQHEGISRLQAPTPESRSSNSTPSVFSVNSSQSALTNASSTSNTSTPLSYASRLSVTESYPLFVTVSGPSTPCPLKRDCKAIPSPPPSKTHGSHLYFQPTSHPSPAL
jgi:hypothetical protein